MPSQLVSRINLDQLYPPFTERLLTLLAALQAAGHTYYALSGFRSHAEQAKLYFQGRTTPGKIVTKAQAGQSLHNFGCAVDLAADGNSSTPGLQPVWATAAYKPLAEEARKMGLEAGYYWKFQDSGHVEWNLAAYGTSLKELQKVYLLKGLPGVWKFLDGKTAP